MRKASLWLGMLYWGIGCLLALIALVLASGYFFTRPAPPAPGPHTAKSINPLVPEDKPPGNVKQADWEADIQHQLASLKQGNIAFTVPDEMSMGRSQTIDAVIGENAIPVTVLKNFIPGKPGQQIELQTLQISLKMKMVLVGDDFTIVPMNSEEQIVGGPTPTTWEWKITPKKSGQLHLRLVASVELDGTPRDLTTLDRDIPVKVSLAYNVKTFATTNWQWILGTMTALIGLLWKALKSRKQLATNSQPIP